VTEAILKRQSAFFEKGPQHLKPMVLRDIAEELTLHESTISRVTTNKYVHTPHGIYELKYFFNSAIGRSDDGDDMASESVKQKIKEMIAAEDPKKPSPAEPSRSTARRWASFRPTNARSSSKGLPPQEEIDQWKARKSKPVSPSRTSSLRMP
jgi:hypothetical protein